MITVVGTAKTRTLRVLWMLEELGLPYDHQPKPPRSPEVTALNPLGLQQLQALVREMPVGEKVLDAILQIVREARPEQSSDDRVRRFIDWGPSPRAGQALMLASRARALLRGRLAPSIEDVEALAEPCLAHRMDVRYDPTGDAPDLEALIGDLVKKAA